MSYKSKELVLSPDTMGIIAPVAIETTKGLGRLGNMMIVASDSIAPIMADMEGRSPELISDETRALMGFDVGDIRNLAAFIARPASLRSLQALDSYYQTDRIGDLAAKTDELTGEPFKRAMTAVLGKRGGIWGAFTDNVFKTRLMGVSPDILNLVTENTQIKGHLLMAAWWAECLKNAQEVHDFALDAMDSHLRSNDRNAGMARDALSNFQANRAVMERVELEMSATVDEGMGMNLLSTEHGTDEQTSAMARVASLLEKTAVDQRAFSDASSETLRAALQMDSLRARMGIADTKHAAHLNLLLASLRWVTASERGALASIDSLKIVLMGAVAQGIRARGVRTGELAGKMEGMLTQALQTASDLTRGQVLLVNDVVGATRRDIGQPGQQIIEG